MASEQLFTLLQTPPAYGFPTAQAQDLEIRLYLKHVSKLPRNVLQLAQNEGFDVNKPTADMIEFQTNKYWLNVLDVQESSKTSPTTTPILHHGTSVVPSHNIIGYLKDKLYDIDNYMSMKEATEYAGYQTMAKEFLTIVQYLLIRNNGYPIASDTMFLIRWTTQSQYSSIINERASALGISTENDATIRLSQLLAEFATILRLNTFFGPQNKISTLDISVAAGVAFCLFARDTHQGGRPTFLETLLYNYYPTLVKHCHDILRTTLGDEYTDLTYIDLDRLTPSIRSTAFYNLLGNNNTTTQQVSQQSTSTTQPSLDDNDLPAQTNNTPQKKTRGSSKKTRRGTLAQTKATSFDSDEEPDDDAPTDLNITGVDVDGVDDNNDSNGNNKVTLSTKVSENILYDTRHALTNTPTQHPTKAYAIVSWTKTHEELARYQGDYESKWFQHLIIFGVSAVVLYFVVTKVRQDYEKEIKLQEDVGEFHHIDTALEDKYNDFQVDEKFLEKK